MEQLTNISVGVDDDAIVVTLTARFPKVDGENLSVNDTIALAELLRTAKGAVVGKPASTSGGDGEPASTATTTSRSRRKSKEETDDGDTATEAADTDTADGGKRTRSRRRSGGEDNGASHGVQPAVDGEGGTSRRSRKRTGGDDAAESVGELKPRSRRARGNAEEAAEAPAEKPAGRTRKQSAGVSDEDLAKAASGAAAVIGHEVVMQVLEEDYSVQTVNEIPQKSRKEFLATLRKEMED